MNFEISNIIESSELKIKLLVYEDIPYKELDLDILSSFDRERFHSFKSDKRKLEFYFTRLLWQRFEAYESIHYTETGKPEISTGFLSISHSSNTIAISHSKTNPIGLDIEHFNPKIKKIKHKFLSVYEIEQHDTEDETTITTLWSIKEAVYKLLDISGLIFRENIRILEIGDINRAQITIPNEKYELVFDRIIFKTFILTYCIKKVE